MTLGHELKVLDVTNNSGIVDDRMTLGHELKLLDSMKNLRLWLT